VGVLTGGCWYACLALGILFHGEKENTMRKLSLGFAFLLVTSAYVFAQSGEQRAEVSAGTATQSMSLRGLKGVRLTVMFGRADGMDAAQRPAVLKVLQDDAKAQIQKAGIPLLQYATEIEDAGSPHLIMTIMMDKPNGFVYPLVTELKLFQQANLGRDPSIAMSVVTWKTGGVGAPEVNLEMLRHQVGTEIGLFVKDYLAANPK
jgi:hypothetical protein